MALALADALRIHSTLQDITRRVPAERIYFRNAARADARFQIPGAPEYFAVDRDRAICGLVNKAVGVHKSIGILIDAGQVSEAAALCRVLMENSFTLAWILLDSGLRLDVFVLADELYQRRAAEIAIEHYPHRPNLCASAQRRLDDSRSRYLAEALAGSWRSWARRPDASGQMISLGAAGMFRDLGITGPNGKQQSFIHDSAYFDYSHDIHSTVWSLREFDFKGSETFRLDVQPRQSRAAEVVNAANLLMIQTLADFTVFTGSDPFQPELDAAWDEMQREAARGG